MRRAVPLLRSDWTVPSNNDKQLHREGIQAQTYGLSSWLPWNGAGVAFRHDSYSVRSVYLTCFGMNQVEGWSNSEERRTAVQRGYREARRVASLLLGDYNPLTPYSLDTTSWIAWQFHTTESGGGVIQAFRRSEAANETLTVKLRGLDANATYEVDNFDGGKETRTGAELMRGLDITLREKPAAAVLVLKVVK
jgi:hypothetical protein